MKSNNQNFYESVILVFEPLETYYNDFDYYFSIKEKNVTVKRGQYQEPFDTSVNISQVIGILANISVNEKFSKVKGFISKLRKNYPGIPIVAYSYEYRHDIVVHFESLKLDGVFQLNDSVADILCYSKMAFGHIPAISTKSIQQYQLVSNKQAPVSESNPDFHNFKLRYLFSNISGRFSVAH